MSEGEKPADDHAPNEHQQSNGGSSAESRNDGAANFENGNIDEPNALNAAATSPPWTDLFYGVMVAPVRTLNFLTDESQITINNHELLGASILVMLSFGISGVVGSGFDMSVESLVSFVFVLITGLLTWITLSCILYLACGWLAHRHIQFRQTLTATGWAFLPLIFTAPISCFKILLSQAYPVVAMLPFIWMVYLQFVAFDQSISSGSAKVLFVLLVGPPVFILVYLFWLSFAFVLITQGIGSQLLSLH